MFSWLKNLILKWALKIETNRNDSDNIKKSNINNITIEKEQNNTDLILYDLIENNTKALRSIRNFMKKESKRIEKLETFHKEELNKESE